MMTVRCRDGDAVPTSKNKKYLIYISIFIAGKGVGDADSAFPIAVKHGRAAVFHGGVAGG